MNPKIAVSGCFCAFFRVFLCFYAFFVFFCVFRAIFGGGLPLLGIRRQGCLAGRIFWFSWLFPGVYLHFLASLRVMAG